MSVVWIPAVEPHPSLRAIRHQINNMLAPVTVAAELLDDGSDTAQLLRRSADRLRHCSEQVGRFLRLAPPPRTRLHARTLCDALAAPTSSTAGPELDVVLEGDTQRLAAAIDELVHRLSVDALTAEITDVTYPDGSVASSLVLTLPVEVSESPETIALLGVPLALADQDPGVAVACREIHVHGGGVRVAATHWQVCLPVVDVDGQGTSR